MKSTQAANAKPPKFDRNRAIVYANMATATILMFCCCYFFFSHVGMFWRDLKSYMFFSPLIMFCGVAFTCFYMFELSTHIGDKTAHFADRFDLPYKIIFSVTLITLLVRSFIGDFMFVPEHADDPTPRLLSVPLEIALFAIFAAIATWCIPKIKDNNNKEF
jgi:hypothetical protein